MQKRYRLYTQMLCGFLASIFPCSAHAVDLQIVLQNHSSSLSWNPAMGGNVAINANACVQVPNPGQTYTVQVLSANGAGPSGQYRLSNGLGEYVFYTVGWTHTPNGNMNSSTATSSGPFQTMGEWSQAQTGAGNETTCQEPYEATLSIFIQQSNIEPSHAGNYTDTLTINVQTTP